MADDQPKDDDKGAAGTSADAKGKPKDDDGDPDEAALGDAGKRALARLRAERDELRTKYETAAEKAKRLDEIEEASKSEQTKALERAAELEKRAAASELKLAKIEAAQAAGLPLSAASRLVGATPAELKRDAEAYAAELASVGGGRRRTTGDTTAQGAGPDKGMSGAIRRAAGRSV